VGSVPGQPHTAAAEARWPGQPLLAAARRREAEAAGEPGQPHPAAARRRGAQVAVGRASRIWWRLGDGRCGTAA